VITWADIVARRAARNATRTAAADAARRLARTRAVLQRLLSRPDPDEGLIAAAEARVEEATALAQEAEAAATAAEAAYVAGLAALPGQLDPAVPCLLLPVRLETRFATIPGGTVLRVRIYPDEIHLDTHERGLTAAEVQVGTAYWQALWDIATEPPPGSGLPDTRPARRVAAWEQVTRRLGPARGALVAAALTPTNQPPAPPAFPAVATGIAPWTRPAWAAAMPERWTVRAWRDGVRIAEAHGESIPRPLAAGPGPQGIDAATDWLTNFTRALEVGMAVILDVGEPRVDLLTVIGVRGTDTAADGAAAVAELLHAHHFTDGLDLLPAGTPTNNTADRRTGVDAHPGPAGRSYDTERAGLDIPGAPARRPAAGTDGDRLSTALGLSAATAGARPGDVLPSTGRPVPDPFATVPHRSDRGLADARDMATVLWPATWGYYGAQMIDEHELLRSGRRWFLDTVVSGGPLPTLRVGSQPYGVLPATPLNVWRPWPDPPDLALLTVAVGQAELRVGFDLDDGHQVRGSWADAPAPPGPAGAWALTAADLGAGPALIGLALVPNDRTGRLTVGEGAAAALSWGADIAVPGVHPTSAAAVLTGHGAVAVATLPDRNGPCAVVVLEHAEPQTGRRSGSVRVGTRLGHDAMDRWEKPVSLPWPATGGAEPVSLRGACVIRPERDDQLALVLLHAVGDDRLTLLVGRGLTARGIVTAGWGDPIEVPIPAGAVLRTAGVTAPAAPGRALLVHWTGEVGGQLVCQYVIAPALTASGVVQPGWSASLPVPAARADADTVAVAVLDAGRDPIPGLATPARRVALLTALRQVWREPVDAQRVPRVLPDPAQTSPRSLLELLSTDAVSASVRTRGAIGPVLAGNLWRLLQREVGPGVGAGYEPRLRAAVEAALTTTGLAVDGRITTIGYETYAEPFTDALVADRTDEQQPLPAAGNFLSWAASVQPKELHAGRGGRGGTEGSLLERLVRHSTLQAWADAAFDIRPPDNAPVPLPEPELVDIADLTEPDPVTPPRTLTSWRHLSEAVFDAAHPRHPGRPVREVLAALVIAAEAPGGATDPAVADLVAHRAALRRLAALPVGDLERLLMGTLDLGTHRLDAWVTAVATTRLAALRAARPDGIHLGGFGIAFDLTARTSPVSDGYVLAPSLAHAATAAIARGGFLAHADDPDGGQLALRLTSRRVRHALDLLDGLRAGHSMGALLGQRFERALHERPGNLNRYLAHLRAIAPATAGKRVAVPADSGPSAAQARGTLDGLSLLRRHTAGTIPWGTTPAGETVALPAADPADPDHGAIADLLNDIADQVDAVGDLAVAESLHQTVQGNLGRAGALLDAVNRGEPLHADPDVVRTPHSGIALTHRVLVLLPAAGSAPAWSTAPTPAARAAAEPAAEAWAASLLGPSAKTRWQALFPAVGGPAGATITAEHTLADLGLCALDIVAAATAADVRPHGDLLRSATLDSLLSTYAAQHPPAGATLGAAPALALGRDPGWPPDDLSVLELLEIGRRIGLLLRAARPARPADLAEPGRNPGVPPDPNLDARASAAVAGLATALNALRDEFAATAATRAALAAEVPGLDTQNLTCALDLPDSLDLGALGALAAMPADTGAVRSALRALALYGVPGAAAETPFGADAEAQAALRRQAHRIGRTAAGRLAAAGAAPGPEDALRAALGEDAIALPRFTAPDPAALRAALTAREAAADAPSATVTDWLADAAEVRAGVARLRDLRLAASACARDGQTRTRIAQLPQPPSGGTDRWAALPLPDADPPATLPAGLVDLVIAGPALDPPTDTASDVLAGPLTGLLVDEWVEVVPSRTTAGAVTFHLDAPGASPPQALLLAVSPQPTRPWSLDLVEETVMDTMRLAQERMVDPDLVPALGHVLPALTLARNDGAGGRGDTIATAFPPA
jgi:hypothetical protein